MKRRRDERGRFSNNLGGMWDVIFTGVTTKILSEAFSTQFSKWLHKTEDKEDKQAGATEASLQHKLNEALKKKNILEVGQR